MKKNIEFYLKLPYHFIVSKVTENDEVYYTAQCVEIKEAKTGSKNFGDLGRLMDDVLKLSIEMRMKFREEIPTPKNESATA